jgi:hypothetical protein
MHKRRFTSNPTTARLHALLAVLLLGCTLVSGAIAWWGDYWIFKDGRTGAAYLTATYGRKDVAYQYTVNGTEYAGKGLRSRDDFRYGRVNPGERWPVYYSASHPWLSSLNQPRLVGPTVGLLLLLLLEILVIKVVLIPGRRWTFGLSGRTRRHRPSPAG